MNLGFDPPSYSSEETSNPTQRRALNCHAGHLVHRTKRLQVPLRGQGVVSEYPRFQPRFARDLDLYVYDAPSYANAGCYCTGDDETSRSLLLGQVWEGYESLLAIAILARTPRPALVLDFGSHIGWFSALAASCGATVVAFEADAENASMTEKNVELNAVNPSANSLVVRTWLDSSSPSLSVDGAEVSLLKADVEGNEDVVIDVCRDLFASRSVQFAMIEISPVLRGHYVETSKRVEAFGYTPFDVPSKGASSEVKAAFESDPLRALVAHCEVKDLRERVNASPQTNFMFVRNDIVAELR